jgi:hypothetical protein
MAFTHRILDHTFTEQSFAGNAYADEAAGFPKALEKIAALGAALLGPGAVSTTAAAIGTGARTLALGAPATLPAGLYQMGSAGSPGNFMVCTLADPVVAAASLTLEAHIAVGSGTFADWIVAPLTATRRPTRTEGASFTVGATDHRALIECTDTMTASLPAASAVGGGFAVGLRNGGSGTVTIAGTIDGASDLVLAPQQAAELTVIGSTWRTSARPPPLPEFDDETLIALMRAY